MLFVLEVPATILRSLIKIGRYACGRARGPARTTITPKRKQPRRRLSSVAAATKSVKTWRYFARRSGSGLAQPRSCQLCGIEEGELVAAPPVKFAPEPVPKVTEPKGP